MLGIATMQAAALATVGQPAHVDVRGRMVLYAWLDRGSGNLDVTQRHVNSVAAQFSVN